MDLRRLFIQLFAATAEQLSPADNTGSPVIHDDSDADQDTNDNHNNH